MEHQTPALMARLSPQQGRTHSTKRVLWSETTWCLPCQKRLSGSTKPCGDWRVAASGMLVFLSVRSADSNHRQQTMEARYVLGNTVWGECNVRKVPRDRCSDVTWTFYRNNAERQRGRQRQQSDPCNRCTMMTLLTNLRCTESTWEPTSVQSRHWPTSEHNRQRSQIWHRCGRAHAQRFDATACLSGYFGLDAGLRFWS